MPAECDPDRKFAHQLRVVGILGQSFLTHAKRFRQLPVEEQSQHQRLLGPCILWIKLHGSARGFERPRQGQRGASSQVEQKAVLVEVGNRKHRPGGGKSWKPSDSGLEAVAGRRVLICAQIGAISIEAERAKVSVEIVWRQLLRMSEVR